MSTMYLNHPETTPFPFCSKTDLQNQSLLPQKLSASWYMIQSTGSKDNCECKYESMKQQFYAVALMCNGLCCDPYKMSIPQSLEPGEE